VDRSSAKERSAAGFDFLEGVPAVRCSSICWRTVAESDWQYLPAVYDQNAIFVDRYSLLTLSQDSRA
jgi:hypothetical protein